MDLKYLFEDMDINFSENEMDTDSYLIPTSTGDIRSIYYRASKTIASPTIFLLHGFPGIEKNIDIAYAMRRIGFNVVCFHYRGSWGSGGDFSFGNAIDDFDTVLKFYLQEERASNLCIDKTNLYFIGHSMGGFVMLNILAKRIDIKGSIAIAPYDFAGTSIAAHHNKDIDSKLSNLLENGAMWLVGTTGEQLRAELNRYENNWEFPGISHTLAGKRLHLIGAIYDEVGSPKEHIDPLFQKLESMGDTASKTLIATDHTFHNKRISLIKELAKVLKTWEKL